VRGPRALLFVEIFVPPEKFGEVGRRPVTGGGAFCGRLIRQASQYSLDTACQLGVQLVSLVLRHLHGTHRGGELLRKRSRSGNPIFGHLVLNY
jgi:hypothetical protein